MLLQDSQVCVPVVKVLTKMLKNKKPPKEKVSLNHSMYASVCVQRVWLLLDTPSACDLSTHIHMLLD